MLGEVLALLLSPLVWLFGGVVRSRRPSPEEVSRFYRSVEWKRVRYTQLEKEPACHLCEASAKSGARMNVDHVRPLHRHWHRRLDLSNLQTLCASCNWGKGGRDKRGR
jgi:5-methylcytosine-specific restriction protein A